MKLVKLLANLGYGSRKQVALMFREGRVTDAGGEVLYADDVVAHEAIRVDDEPLDPAPGLLLLLHKPVGYTCSTKDPGRVVYDLLPPRFRLRNPVLSTVGRLDRDTSGLLLWTTEGPLLHRLTHPRYAVPRVYHAALTGPWQAPPPDLELDDGHRPEILELRELGEAERHPGLLMPEGTARLATITIASGKFHEVRRIFAALGSEVLGLCRVSYGPVELPRDLPAGEHREIDLHAIFSGTLHPAPPATSPEVQDL